MKLTKLGDALELFINNEILPHASILEKTVLVVVKELELFNVKEMVVEYLNHPFIQRSPNLWLDESKTEISTTVLKKLLYKVIDIYGGEYKYNGYTFSINGIPTMNLFDGYKFNRKDIDTLFKYIETEKEV